MPRNPPSWLRALGSQSDLPYNIKVGDVTYRHLRTFKHDFFAATGLYEGPEGKVVLKVGRQAGLFGLPMAWIGRLLTGHEARLYQIAGSVEGVPRFVGRWGPTGLVHEFIEGRPLARDDRLSDEFFPRLAAMLDRMHAMDVAYVDLEKPENILVGTDGRPYLIDFQISWHWPVNRGGSTWPARMILDILQQSDRYHLLKHWRRLRRDQLEACHDAQFAAPPVWIRLHRALFRPVTVFRRQVLVWLGARSSTSGRSPG
jgi:hypothetical protein